MENENLFQRQRKIQSDQNLRLKQAKSLFPFENQIKQNLTHSPYLRYIISYVKKKIQEQKLLFKT